MPGDFKIRYLREDEHAQHLAILNLVFNPWGSAVDWDNKYKQPGMDVTKNVMIVEEEGEWVGGLSFWIRDALLNDKKAKVYVVGDAYCHPDHLGKGVNSAATKAYRKLLKADQDAALSITFTSNQRAPFSAAQKHGYYPILRPTTKIKLLKPDRLISLVDGRKLKILERFEGTCVRIATEYGDFVFVVKNGQFTRAAETTRADIIVRSRIESLFRVYARSVEGKRALITAAAGMVLSGKLLGWVSLRSIPRLIRGVLGW